MQTETLTFDDLTTPLDPLVVEQHVKRTPGVADARANFVSGSVTVTFDSAKTSVAQIREAVIACGFHCRGAFSNRGSICKPFLMSGCADELNLARRARRSRVCARLRALRARLRSRFDLTRFT